MTWIPRSCRALVGLACHHIVDMEYRFLSACSDVPTNGSRRLFVGGLPLISSHHLLVTYLLAIPSCLPGIAQGTVSPEPHSFLPDSIYNSHQLIILLHQVNHRYWYWLPVNRSNWINHPPNLCLCYNMFVELVKHPLLDNGYQPVKPSFSMVYYGLTML